jgi:hypothetical protein
MQPLPQDVANLGCPSLASVFNQAEEMSAHCYLPKKIQIQFYSSPFDIYFAVID